MKEDFWARYREASTTNEDQTAIRIDDASEALDLPLALTAYQKSREERSQSLCECILPGPGLELVQLGIEPLFATIAEGFAEDLELRAKARPLHPLSIEVVSSAKDHPCFPTVCPVCGSLASALSHCGRPLCIPCWKAKAGRKAVRLSRAVIRLEATKKRIRHLHGLDYVPGVRFVTVTLKVHQGHLKNGLARMMEYAGRLRRSKFWTSHVIGDYPKLEFALSADEDGRLAWYVHLHSLADGRFLPAGPDVAHEGEGNLRDVWHRITGDSFIVKVVPLTENPREIVGEIEKYLAKPISESCGRIQDWPDDLRRELAEVVAGPYRIRWFCPSHRARTREKCLSYSPPPGFQPIPCEGEYRLERSGFRGLMPTGVFREVLGKIDLEREEKGLEGLCIRCGLDRPRGPSYWEERGDFGHPNAAVALNLIQTHTLTDCRSERRRNPVAEGESGWIPPPGLEGFSLRLVDEITGFLRKKPSLVEIVLERAELAYPGVPSRTLVSLLDGQLRVGNWVEVRGRLYVSCGRGGA